MTRLANHGPSADPGRTLARLLQSSDSTNPRLFGSVARGDATPDSGIDLMVDLLPGGGNELLRSSTL